MASKIGADIPPTALHESFSFALPAAPKASVTD
jgi:hypothetical protein